jgi:hypothetical protein
MAFVALVCFVFMFAIFEFGRVVMILQVMNSAARTGARQAVIIPTSFTPAATATAQVQTTVNNALSGHQWATAPTVQVYQADSNGNNVGSWTSTTFGGNIVVQIDADYPLLFPTFGWLPSSGAAPNSLHLSVKSMMRMEAN